MSASSLTIADLEAALAESLRERQGLTQQAQQRDQRYQQARDADAAAYKLKRELADQAQQRAKESHRIELAKLDAGVAETRELLRLKKLQAQRQREEDEREREMAELERRVLARSPAVASSAPQSPATPLPRPSARLSASVKLEEDEEDVRFVSFSPSPSKRRKLDHAAESALLDRVEESKPKPLRQDSPICSAVTVPQQVVVVKRQKLLPGQRCSECPAPSARQSRRQLQMVDNGLVRCDVQDCREALCHLHYQFGRADLAFNHDAIRSSPPIGICAKHSALQAMSQTSRIQLLDRLQRCGSRCPPESVDQEPFMEREAEKISVKLEDDELVYDNVSLNQTHRHLILRKASEVRDVEIKRFQLLGQSEWRYGTVHYTDTHLYKTVQSASYDIKRCSVCKKDERTNFALRQCPIKCGYRGCETVVCAKCLKVSYHPTAWLCDAHLRRDHPFRTSGVNWNADSPASSYSVQCIIEAASWSDSDEPVYTGLVLCADEQELVDKKPGGLYDCELFGFANATQSYDTLDLSTALVTEEALRELCPQLLRDYLEKLARD